MIWKTFYSAWKARIGVNMAEETLPQWSAYVSGLPDDLAVQALDRLTEAYFEDRRRNGTVTPPTLWQFRRIVGETYAETARPAAPTACPLCDGEGVVMVLWSAPGQDFPPDPAGDLPRRSICAAPCPECAGERYTDARLRDRVRRFCRSNRRREELLIHG